VRKDKDKIERGEVSRRDFLIGAGSVVVGGAIGAGITYPLVSGKDGEVTTKTVEISKTVTAPATTIATTVAADTVTTTKTVGAGETVTTTVGGGTETITTTVGDGGIEPAFEPEETYLAQAGGNCSEICSIEKKNGKIVRIRPLHYDEQYTAADLTRSLDWSYTVPHRKTGATMTYEPRNKACATQFQLCYKKRVYSPNRVLYPLKRVDWEPGGANTNTQNRGKSKFVRISWDEVTDIVASEIKRIQDKYGAYAIGDKSDSCHRENKNLHGAACSTAVAPLLQEIGCTRILRNADSWEGIYYGQPHIWGNGGQQGSCPGYRTNMGLNITENCDMMIYAGCDRDTYSLSQQGGFSSREVRWFRDIGVKSIYIAPDLNWQNAANPDKWIPVIPGRDDALWCAIIHTWLKEDTWDKDYVATHAVGMEYIEDYIMGRSDDMKEKTAAWAAPRTGIPEWTIKALAREWAKKRTSWMHVCGGAYIRGPFTHECARLEAILLSMQGLGRPGVMQYCNYFGAVGPRWVTTLSPAGVGLMGRFRKYSSISGPPFPVPQVITRLLMATAIFEGHAEHWGCTGFAPVEDQFIKYTYPIPEAEGGTEMRMLWQDHHCHTGCWNDSNMFIHAIRQPKIECFVVQSIWFMQDCQFADIVLPACTSLEEEDIQNLGTTEVAGIFYKNNVVEKVGESKSDDWIVFEIAKKLEEKDAKYAGVADFYTGGKTFDEWVQEGYDLSGASEFVTLDDLKEKQYCLSSIASDWKNDKCGLIDFYNNPDENPLLTPTGKLEFYSERLAEHFPDDDERGPYPKYQPGGPGYHNDESLDIEYGAEKCKTYPLVMNANHVRWRVQSQYDDVPWLRECPTAKVPGYDGYWYEALWIGEEDAAARGIKNGDIVKVFNERGIELAGAYISKRIIPGAVHMDHGSNTDYIANEEDEYDDRKNKWVNRSGTLNGISVYQGLSKIAIGMVVSSYLVDVAKVTGDEMQEWREAHPEAFSRYYDPAYGLLLSAWVEGGMK